MSKQQPKGKAGSGPKRHRQPVDPSQPLRNSLHESFAQDVFSGSSLTDAYRKHFNRKGGMAGKTINEAASRLHSKVLARIAFLQSQVASEKIMDRIGLAEMYSEMLRTRHSDFLTMSADGVWMHDISRETLNQAALKKVRTRCAGDGDGQKQFDEIELESKVAVGQALAKLMGYDAPTKQEHSGPGGEPIQYVNRFEFV